MTDFFKPNFQCVPLALAFPDNLDKTKLAPKQTSVLVYVKHKLPE